MADYWNQALAQRMSRRRGLAAASAGALGAAFLAACGGSDSGGGSDESKGPGSSLTKPVDSIKQAKRGGILKRNVGSDFPSLDPMQSFSGSSNIYETVLGRLVAFKPGVLASGQEDAVEGELIESWEVSPDKTTITLKMRPNVKFHDIAPVNGRVVDVEDVLFTWKRFSAVGTARAGYANSVNPNAPVVSMTAPDAKTIVVKLKEPLVYALSMFGARENVNITPKEAESGYDPRSKMISIGPYALTDYQRSIGFTLKRHEGYFNKDIAFVDQVDLPIVSERAAQAAQFRAGRIFVAGGASASAGAGYPINQEDILPLKKELPELVLYAGDVIATGNRVIFGWKTPALRDERVRQAFSMSYDRDLWIEVWNNASKFEAEGIPVERRWSSSFPSFAEAYDGWRLEPRDAKTFGPNAKYFKHDIVEAKKLLSAAGFANGIEMPSTFVKGTEYGVTFQKEVEVRQGMNAEVGFKFQNNPIDYQTEFIPKYRDVNGNFEGIAYRSGPPPLAYDPVGQMTYWYYSKAGASFLGYDVNGKGDLSGDPAVDTAIAKAQQEFDIDKRKTLITDLVKYTAGKMYYVYGVSGAGTLALTWPALQNFRAYRGSNANSNRIENTYWWLDATKAPIK